MSFRKIRLLAPLFFWVFQLSVLLIRSLPVIDQEGLCSLINTILVTYPLDILTFCLFYFYILPMFTNPNKRKWSLIIAPAFIIIWGFVWAYAYQFSGFLNGGFTWRSVYFMSSGHTLVHGFYGIIFRLAIDWFEKKQQQTELEKQNIKAELALLQSQLNPHFLFNTLNNINAYITSNPEKSSYGIIKLSEILRYLLYEANAEKVPLFREVQCIENYIELQKLRYPNPDYIRFTVEGDYDKVEIPSMLFLPFIENAFKHGVKNVENGVCLLLKVENNQLIFECRNVIKKHAQEKVQNIGGIGIPNIRKRLGYLFPDKHELHISKTESEFQVKLTIEL